MLNADADIKKWGAVLDHEGATPIKDNYRRAVTAKLLENTEVAIREQNAQGGSLTEAGEVGGASAGVGTVGTGFDPILISMVRRAMPNLIAYDIAGVQPMQAPTGLIFAMKAQKGVSGSGGVVSPGGLTDNEILFGEADTAFSAEGTTPTSNSPFNLGIDDGANTKNFSPGDAATNAAYSPVGGRLTSAAEFDTSFPQVGFSIERTTVTAKTRQLKADYSMELAQDLKAVHGLDAESELANILSGEILAEINREVIRKIVTSAKIGLENINESYGTASGVFDLVADADGRWMVEKFKSLIFQLEVEANAIAKATRRGKGNFVLCSSNIASALAAAGQLDYTPALSANLNVDDTGNTFAGVLNGRMKVYVDPYATVDYACVGYRGTNPFDAGMFYAPYVPLTMVRAVDEDTFQPKIAFKTRYGMAHNPFTSGAAGANTYYRKIKVANINNDGAA
jgi:hypothetical protein